MSKSQSPDFDYIKQLNVYGIEFWSARDLMPLLGYGRNWQNFETALQKAMIACEESGQSVENHFNAGIKMVSIGSRAKRETKDFSLSRLACYLVAMNGNPRKPEIAAAQNYFAVSTRANEMHLLREQQEERLARRIKVSASYQLLDEAAKQAGVQSESFGIFIDAGYLGLHRHTLQELKERKGIPRRDDYLDRIGTEELSAIDFKNTQTRAKLERDQIEGLDEAAQTHYFIGDQVRKAIEAMHAPMPEDMPTGPSIRKHVEERRRKHKKIQKAQTGDQASLFDEPPST